MVRVFRFKSCPRCKGDILVDCDCQGWYEQCLQCGYQRDLKDIIEVQQQRTQDLKKKQFSR